MNNTLNNSWVVLCILFLVLFLAAWQLMTASSKNLPGPWPVAQWAWEFLSDPFYDKGTNDLGIGTLAFYSLAKAGVQSRAERGIEIPPLAGLNSGFRRNDGSGAQSRAPFYVTVPAW
jgi:hypothetical protein